MNGWFKKIFVSLFKTTNGVSGPDFMKMPTTWSDAAKISRVFIDRW